MAILIYIRSIAHVTDRRGQIGVTHPYAIPLLENAFVTTCRVDDLLYEAESAHLLELAASLQDRLRASIQVIDMSRLPGRLHAWQQGITRTPSVVIDGKIFAGLAEAGRALQEWTDEPCS